MEFAIFLDRHGVPTRDAVRDHVLALRALEREGRLIAAGPLGDGSGGLILAAFEDAAAASAYAEADAFVRGGTHSARVVSWERSHAGNFHLGVLAGED
ncbi:MAG: hypothetical protein FJX76_07620 [Armatimonadetes bacterium]|nr:hypothetical protein [Armatimonadota bacterium]